MIVWVVVGMMQGCFSEMGVYADEEMARAEYRKMKEAYDIEDDQEAESENVVILESCSVIRRKGG